MFPDDDYTEVAAKVTGSLDRFGCWNAGWSVPTSSAVTQARKRLGRRVFAEVFERTCGPVAGEAGPHAGLGALGMARGSFLRRWRLLAIDGFEVDLPDSKENAAEFGYAGSGENRSAFPKARVVALAECGTQTFVAAEIDAYAVGEKTLAQRLYPLREDPTMSDDEMTPDQRLHNLASTALTGYRSSTVSLRGLIDDLDAVWNNLPFSEWGEEFRSHWWTLEQVYAVALDREELVAMPADAQADIDEAIRELERLMNSWPTPPETVV